MISKALSILGLIAIVVAAPGAAALAQMDPVEVQKCDGHFNQATGACETIGE